MLTTIYLGAEEARSLHVLEAYVLRKTRMSFPPYGVDVFHDALAGLVLAEAEEAPAPGTPVAASISMDAVVAPPGALAEVTLDVRFTGGSLARMTSADLRAALTPYAQ